VKFGLRMCTLVAAGLLAWPLRAAPADESAGHPPVSVRTLEPRPYGHVVGDLIERSIDIALPAGADLRDEGLPRPGRIDNWFEVRRVQRLRQAGGVQLQITYQVVNSPRAVATAELPAMVLQLTAGPSAAVPAWPVHLSALTPTTALARAGLDELQADIAPERAALAPIAARLALWGALLAALAFALALRRFPHWAVWRRRAPFRAAMIDVRRLARSGGAPAARLALARLHAAFNAAAGQAVFAERLDVLYAARPTLRAMQSDIDAFFAQSRSEFFAQRQDQPVTIAELVALSERLARCEAQP
jgi:mxaA protein